MSDPAPPVHLVKGRDEVELRRVVGRLVDELVGGRDRGLVLEELTEEQYMAGRETPDLTAVVNAAQTPPFLGDRRVVVARQAGLFSSSEAVQPLVDYLQAPLETSSVVLVWEKGPKQQKLAAVPKKLAQAVRDAGGVTLDTAPPAQSRARNQWLADQIAASGLRLDAAASRLVATQLGEDVNRVGSLLETLAGAYGPDARLGVEEVQPFLGEKGGVAPWDLTDAIDVGDVSLALERLRRLLGAGERPALGILYTLHGHYQKMLVLDGREPLDRGEVAELLGVSPFPAEKAWKQAQRLGHEGISRAIQLLARADLDLKGRTGEPPELVLEILVARLAHLRRSA